MNTDIDSDIAKLVSEARKQRGGKPAKYTNLDKYEEIIKLVNADVQLPFIVTWLAKTKGEHLVLNTLRKYVVFKLGRSGYEDYLKRNGWLKTKKGEKKKGENLDEGNMGGQSADAIPPPNLNEASTNTESPPDLNEAPQNKVERLLPDGSLNPEFLNQCREQTRSIEK